MSKSKLLTEAEAARIMNCSAITLYRRRQEGKIHHWRKIGRLVRYTQEDIDNNIAELAACRPTPVVQRPVTEARFG